jgi:hypothetical protein
MSNALIDVAIERDRQDAKWGGPTHDAGHPTQAVLQFIHDRVGRAFTLINYDEQKARQLLIEIGALAVAAVDSMDRKAKARVQSCERCEFESGLSHNDPVYVCKNCGKVEY